MGAIKTVGKSGQISLGKQYAGQQVLVDEIEPGVWVLKIGRFVPQSEQWLYAPDVESELDQAIDWAEKNPPQACNLTDIEERIK